MGAVAGVELEGREMAESSVDSGGADDAGMMEKILVSVRMRPLNEKEIATEDPCDWECISDRTIIFRNCLPERSLMPTGYTFDRVFGSESTTRQVYEDGAKEVALLAVSGINSSIFAYGQTSSGKTYTMNGITEYTVSDIYDYIKKHQERAFVLKFSAVEIYNEAVIDLLSSDSTPLRLLDYPERGTIIEKLSEVALRDWGHLRELLFVCEAHRKIGETSLNERSSRSHQILRLTVESSAKELLGRDNTSTLVASVNFVDLAGSERASQAQSVGARLKEGCHINRSLLTLGTVIRKLSKGRNGHIPYRESKLTRILQPSLGGNARTAIICTICPARSHIEQSKNTLLFASCAKEVITNARVNVVMSDKALVKHLQRELARLENELSYPGAASKTIHFEALLREKDAQIRKMERQIRELMQERDLANSRLEDLLKATGVYNGSRQWEKQHSEFSSFNAANSCEESASEVSGIAYQSMDTGSSKFSTSEQNNNYYGGYAELPQNSKRRNIPTSRLSTINPRFSGLHSVEDDSQEFCSDDESICKEVQCIEIDNTSALRSEKQISSSESLTPSAANSNRLDDHEPHNEVDENLGSLVAVSSNITLEYQLQNSRETIDNLARYPGESSPWTFARGLPSSRGPVLTRSQSCSADVEGLFFDWFQEPDENDSTPASWFLKDFPGGQERLQRRKFALNLHDQGLLEFDKIKSVKQLMRDDQGNDDDLRTAKDVGVDPMPDILVSPSHWPEEFERKQQEIIELWHECNVPLVHRTYFFLLFKGDPSDSIYIEVEHRRLLFIKTSLARGIFDDAEKLIGQSASLALSSKNLRRERMMLYRQMSKRLLAEERESLYIKWGIALDSKQRRLQLARRIWSKTKDMEHIIESASLVAKLIGLVDPGKAMKEIFGLTLTTQQNNRRLYSWRHGISHSKNRW